MEREFKEIIDFVHFFDNLQNSESKFSNKTRVRVLVYCQIMEAHFIYMIIYNLSRTILGKDYSSTIFFKTKKGCRKKAEYPTQKMKAFLEAADEIQVNLKEIFDELYFNNLRNAFYHSQYIIDRRSGHFVITKYLSFSSANIHKKATTPILFNYDVIETLFMKSLIYLNSFKNVYEKFISEYLDGRICKTNFGNMKYETRRNKWSWVQ